MAALEGRLERPGGEGSQAGCGAKGGHCERVREEVEEVKGMKRGVLILEWGMSAYLFASPSLQRGANLPMNQLSCSNSNVCSSGFSKLLQAAIQHRE